MKMSRKLDRDSGCDERPVFRVHFRPDFPVRQAKLGLKGEENVMSP
jgi:hypothetical protein